MGVNGLWTVLQPCARPTNLATLNRKRLAVDASIWIYQFLKAVRDKEGNALRNSHVVGFFRRICKLLWFGIRPVFVFDGGAPALKRATLQARRRRREGRREDAVRTAGRLLAVQMQRIAGEEEDKRKKHTASADSGAIVGPGPAIQDEQEEAIPDADKLVYVEEIGLSKQERQQNRRFYKQDAYHLPELDTSIEAMGKPEDPRIMSVEELEEYARQFHSGENIDLYDFSKIDFDGEFFKSLPPADRYNILNAARVRSRLRMGLSKVQLDEMFPDRMAFSRFQIERVRERNHLTQRLMFEVGMTGTDLTIGVNARIAGEKNREYILVKNDGVEGGWALGVVSRENGAGAVANPIDVDKIDVQFQGKDENAEWEDDDVFEDVPIEGLNRLPKVRSSAAARVAQQANDVRRALYQSRRNETEDDVDGEDSLFVGGDDATDEAGLFGDSQMDLEADEDEDLSRAIAMSLQTQHGIGDTEASVAVGEDKDETPPPVWAQTAVAAAKPVTKASGRMVAHMVNNRANAAVPKRRRASSASSDSDVDLQTALAAAARKREQQQQSQPPPKPAERAPVQPNVKKPWDGPLPFEKIDWKKTIFGKTMAETPAQTAQQKETGFMEPESDEELEGGFEKGTLPAAKESRPLPPWMVDNTDIRDSVKQQQQLDERINDEDQALVEEEAQIRRRKGQNGVVEIESSDDENDVEMVDGPPLPSNPSRDVAPASVAEPSSTRIPEEDEGMGRAEAEMPKGDTPEDGGRESPDVEFEDVALPEKQPSPAPEETIAAVEPREALDAADLTDPLAPIAPGSDGEFDEFSDPEEEELLAQMAGEAEEHARFASTLNNKSEKENQDAYERELRALRSQQKRDRRDADEVTQIMVAECQALLRLFGIPYVTAPMEAEAQCAELVALGLVDGIVTDDSDVFLFGATRVYKNMFNSNKFVECYLAADLEKELSLAREQLVALALLLGSDYTEGLSGVGPVTAVEVLSEFPGGPDGLARFREWWTDVQAHPRPRGGGADTDASSPFRRKFRKAHATKLFLPPGWPSPAVADAYLHPQVDPDPQPFQWGVPNLAGLRDFLMATIGWSQERTDEVLVPVIRDMNRRDAEGTQSNITRYFEGGVGVGAKETFAPRKRAKGSKRLLDAVGRLKGANAGAGGSDMGFPVAAPGPRKRTKRRGGAGRAAAAAADDDDDDDDDADDDVDDENHGNDDDAHQGEHSSSEEELEENASNSGKKKARVQKAKALAPID